MIRILRYLSLRFWLVCMVSLPLSFWALPGLTAWLPGVSLSGQFGALFILVGLGLELILDFVGTRRIRSLIREGDLWERSGIRSRAEKKYIRALGIFDSAWISPWSARRVGPLLMEAMARFYLTGGSRHPGFETAAALNLSANPGDESLAMLWLGQQKQEALNGGLVQSVLTALADAHYSHPEIGRRLIPIFIGLGRVDFSAQRLYRNFLDLGPGTSQADKGLRDGILDLMGKNASLPIAPAAGITAGRTLGDVRNGAPGVTKASSPKIDRPYLRQGRAFTAKGLREGRALARAGVERGLSVLRGMGAFLPATIRFIRRNEKFRLYCKWGGMGGLGLWLMLFVWNTFSHVVKSTDQPAHRIEVKISKPLTIQVAAYLKQSHADRYVAALKKKGIRARVKKTGAGGKTWFLVRVSEFTDKTSAADYGNRLKSQKIIDDFFVSNK